MSVLVTTSFSQGAVFYAGETLSCTIAFTNTLPILPKSPSTSSSLTKQERQKSPPPRVSYNKTHRTNGHSRTPSTSSTQDFVQDLPSIEQDNATGLYGKSRSLTSLASSTLAYLTGYTTESQSAPTTPPSNTIASNIKPHNGDNMDTSISRETKWEQQEKYDINGIQMNENDPIAIELGSHDHITPRTSIDTVTSSYMHPISTSSRRSSTDSLSSSHPYYTNSPMSGGQQHHYHQQQQYHSSLATHPINARRLSRLLKSPSTPSLMKKPEHLLWGFAQVVGQFVVDPTLINNNEFAPLKQKTMYRPHGTGFGGGGGLWNGKPDSKIDTRTTPVFSTPPSILFVDLDLAPGETKKYSYKLKLPNDLPPSHRGKAIRFNYYLVVGTQRSGSAPSTRSSGMQHQGQVVQLRFRVLNHVSEDGSRPIFDLMNPVVMYKDEAQVELVPEINNKAKRSASISSIASANSAPISPIASNNNIDHHRPLSSPSTSSPEVLKERTAFMDYVNELLEKSTNGHDDIQEITRRESDAYDEQRISHDDDEEIMTEQDYRKTCAQVVSRITHSSRKAMYDLCKNNQRVAKLQLTKMAHRLGEPVLGILDFSEASLSTYKVSIFLESHEIVESSISLRQPEHIARVSRKCHSEFHTFCLNHRRLAFSLPIPTTASPEFQTTGVKLQYNLKFEFITNNQTRINQNQTSISSSSPYLSINIDERHQHFQAQPQVQVSNFDCHIPIKVYGSPNGSDRAIYGRPHTFPVQ
ncbi:Rgp1-domain-containing protein [Halteromyces radiatus]|uniref:Rgp1-domain-containing protein n=1 Tax=Halteromyces radiatus TaxID=101107 RepID=UPI00221ED2B9|nr:Rgp1-domain-containing protein [Halteromyces radiatus]KAI8084935.1 Rgp1-domain-containing protein [Halteromyces radiatus]